MTDVVGSAAFELRAVRDRLKGDLRAAESDLKNFGDKAERDVGASGKRLGSGLSGVAAAATTGFAALAAVLAVVAAGAVKVGIESFRMAESIADTAKRANVSTTALQEFREVARRSGEDIGSADRALEGFNKKLGEAASGLSEDAMKAFAAIGINQTQLRSFTDTEQALEVVIDRIGDLSSESDRAAIAEKLGLGPLANALREGSDEIARLRDEARQMGVVLDDELIQKGAEASQRMDDLSTVVGIQLAGAFLSLSDEVIAFTGYLAGALQGLNDFLGRYDTAKGNFALAYGQDSADRFFSGDIAGAGKGIIRNTLNGRSIAASRALQAGERNPQFEDADDPAFVNQRLASTPQRRSLPAGPSRIVDTSRPRRGPRDTSARDAIRAAELEARRAERFQDELDRARQRLLGLAEAEADTAESRLAAAQDSIKADRQTRDADLDRQVIAGELTGARRAILAGANAEADAVEDRVVFDRAFREISEERLAEETLLANLAADLVSLQIGGARTARERQRLELELLQITQRQRRTALAEQLEREGKAPAFRAEALREFDRVSAGQQAAAGRNNPTALGQFRDQSLQTAEEVREAYESIAIRGLDSLNDGIVDAIVNSRNLGEVFSQVAKQIIADLAAIAVRKAITEPLADMLFGGSSGGGGGGGFLGSVLGFGRSLLGGAPTASSGGSNGGLLPGRLLRGDVLPIAGPKTSSFGSLSQAPMGGGPQRIDVMVTTDDPKFRAYVRKEAQPLADQAYSRAMTGAPRLTMSQTAQQQQHTVGRKMR